MAKQRDRILTEPEKKALLKLGVKTTCHKEEDCRTLSYQFDMGGGAHILVCRHFRESDIEGAVRLARSLIADGLVLPAALDSRNPLFGIPDLDSPLFLRLDLGTDGESVTELVDTFNVFVASFTGEVGTEKALQAAVRMRERWNNPRKSIVPASIRTILEKFLASRNLCDTGWPDISHDEMDAFEELVTQIKEHKWGLDPDGDLPVATRLSIRKEGRFPYVSQILPVDDCDTEEKRWQRIYDLIGNVASVAEALQGEARYEDRYPLRPRLKKPLREGGFVYEIAASLAADKGVPAVLNNEMFVKAVLDVTGFKLHEDEVDEIRLQFEELRRIKAAAGTESQTPPRKRRAKSRRS